MEISPLGQAYLLLLCVSFGAILGAFYDLFRVWRSFVISKKILASAVRFVGDLLLLTFAGVGTVLLCYYFNNGEVRFFAILGILVGFFAWRATLSRLFVPAVRAFVGTMLAIIRLFISPLVKIFKYLVNILRKTICYMQKALAKIMIMVYNIRVKKSVIKRSEKGFIQEHKK